MSAASHAAPPLISIAPFGTLLLAIAAAPLLPRVAHWWERNLVKLGVSLVLGVIALLALALSNGSETAVAALGHALNDYVPFIVLLTSLYVISGGIYVGGAIGGTPAANTTLLALGAVLANALGTTGASMVLIRPLLRSNAHRTHRAHQVIFFIFIVSNMGGLLTPMGDPPLFLGYLRGVPFGWTFGLWHVWAVAVGAALLIFYGLDRRMARLDRERSGLAATPDRAEAQAPDEPRVRLGGTRNIVLLAVVVWATAALVPGDPFHGTEVIVMSGLRELVMIGCAVASIATTPRELRKANHFTYAPILEVAALFIGLFMAMQPALAWLNANADSLGVHSPFALFWATGLLSSMLDNAPTYLAFAQLGVALTPADTAHAVPFGTGAIAPDLLAAVSCGAVLMGANTYIGNGPNFMVAAVAREDGVPMPTFVGYMAWSALVLLPIFAFVSWLFFL